MCAVKFPTEMFLLNLMLFKQEYLYNYIPLCYKAVYIG